MSFGFCIFCRRPSGIPEQDVSSVFIPYHQGQEEYVRRELKKLQKENAALAERVKAGRDGVLHTEQRIAAAVEEWKVRGINVFTVFYMGNGE